MPCLACRGWSGGPVCPECTARMRPGGHRLVAGSLVVRSAFIHDGPARELVHRLKYEGLIAAARPLAEAIAADLPANARALVPVPRVTWRRIRIGVDPAPELARALAIRTGIPVIHALRAPLIGPRHAGRGRTSRPAPDFGLRARVPAGTILVDDVLTTGTTLAGAVAAVGIRIGMAVTATVADR